MTDLIQKEQIRSYAYEKAVCFDISGNDSSGDGSKEYPFKTAQAAIDYIKATYTPSQSDQYTAMALTPYASNEAINLTSSDWINVYAPGNSFKVNDMIIGSNNIVTIGELYRQSGTGEVVRKVNSGTSYLHCITLENNISAGTIKIDNGRLEINANRVSAQTNATTLITQDPGASGSKCIIRSNIIQGKVFTVLTDTEVALYGDYLNGDISINAGANSIISGYVNKWNGNITSSGALAKFRLGFLERGSSPNNDVTNEDLYIILPQKVVKPIYNYTSNTTLKATQSGSIITNVGATGNLSHTLPKANDATKGMDFTFIDLAGYRITAGSSGSAFRFVEANGDAPSAGSAYTVPKYSTAVLRNFGEFGSFGYWQVIVEAGRWSA